MLVYSFVAFKFSGLTCALTMIIGCLWGKIPTNSQVFYLGDLNTLGVIKTIFFFLPKKCLSRSFQQIRKYFKQNRSLKGNDPTLRITKQIYPD